MGGPRKAHLASHLHRDLDDRDYVHELAERLDRMTDAELTALLPKLNRHSIVAIERVFADRRAAGWRSDPLAMARHLEGAEVQDWPYQRYLAARFRAAVTGESRVQVWNLPAQTGKSKTLQRGCVWALDRDPGLPIIYLSYGDLLAREAAMFVRDIAVDHGAELRFQLRPDLRRQGRWATSEGGGMLATGIGGSVSGFPAGLVIIDDPLKNWQEAHSEARRNEVWNEIVAVARLRLREGGALILAHTRWHLDDPSGRMHRLSADLGVDVEFVTMPMLATERDPLGRQPGEVLQGRFTLDEAYSRALFLGSYLASALEQQDPQPEEGGEIRRSWWRWIAAVPEPQNADAWLSSTDTKLKDSGTGDYVVTQVWARVGPNYVLCDQLRGQWTLLGTKVALALVAHRWPHVSRHVVENSGNGPEVMQQLGRADPDFTLTDELAAQVGVADHERAAVEAIVRAGLPGLVPQNVNQNKIVRTRAVAPFIESGHVQLIEGKAWAAALVDEAASFPKGEHDDMLDAMTQAISRLRVMEGEAQVPTGLLPRSPVGARSIRIGSSGLVPTRR